ncbi:MAG: hypothetical protein ACM3SO_16840 [Betaproteobacteria bacterium]
MRESLPRSPARIAAVCIALIVAACGGGGGGASGSSSPPSAPAVELLAGTSGGPGYFDAQGPGAKFSYPQGIALDFEGYVYVADTGNRVIRKIGPQRMVGTLAGWPGDGRLLDGMGSAARFGASRGIATDAQGNLYVADTTNHVIRLITPAGMVSTLAGTGVKGNADGPASSATFSSPSAVAVDKLGNVYVGDTGNTAIRSIPRDGVVTTLAGGLGNGGHADGPAAQARFGAIMGLAVDDLGNLYIADWSVQVIMKLGRDGMVSTIAGTPMVVGVADGPASTATFYAPSGIAVDPAGNVYVADKGNRAIRRISADGIVTTIAGKPNASFCAVDGDRASAQFASPTAVAISASGALYVADDGASLIRVVSPEGNVTTLAGTAANCGGEDGVGMQASFGSVADLAIDAVGNLLVADGGRRAIRKVTPSAQVSTLAQTGVLPPSAVAVDGSGQAYVGGYMFPALCRLQSPCDWVGKMYRMGTDGQMQAITPVSSSDGTGAEIKTIAGLAVGPGGDLYWTDFVYNIVRKLSPTLDATTIAGVGAYAGGTADGTGASARFSSPAKLAVDSGGNLYLADSANHTIRKITSSGVVSTFAGAPGASGAADGVGAAARFSNPTAVALDNAGNLYAADTGNCLVRKVTPAAMVTTVAGIPGRCGFTPGSLSMATLDSPTSLAVKDNDLYVGMPYGIAVIRNRP